MERLVYFTGDVALVDNLGIEECMAIQEPLKKLHEYEIAEEQGLLLRLPCKVGDRVYVIVTVLDYGEIGDKATKTYYITERKFELYMLSDYGKYVFGKTVFLTKEEAEQKLAEMKEVEHVYK